MSEKLIDYCTGRFEPLAKEFEGLLVSDLIITFDHTHLTLDELLDCVAPERRALCLVFTRLVLRDLIKKSFTQKTT